MSDSGCKLINGIIDKNYIGMEEMENLNAIADNLKIDLKTLLNLLAR